MTKMTQAQHIVVVDDEQPAREMVGDYLRMHGFTVSLCDGGASLRKSIAQQVPDLIVLDLNMPEEDGLSIIRDLKQRTSVPIIMLTATASAIDRVVGLELGADDYLAKPCELRELLARIRSVLRRRSAGQQPAAAPPRPARRPAPDRARVRFGTKWLDHDAQALRDDEGNEHPAHRLGIRPAEGLRRQSQAGAVARPVAGTGQCPRRRGLRPGHRPANHADSAKNRARSRPPVGHPDRARRRLSVLPGRRNIPLD